jgi:hypothetical protein
MLHVKPGKTVTLASGQTLTLAGNMIDNGSIVGDGTVTFTGSTPVIISPSLPNLTFSSSNAKLMRDLSVVGNINLSGNSTLAIDTFDLTINTITNFGATAFISTLDSLSLGGFVIKNLAQADGNFIFPLGITGSYTPVSIVNLGTTGNVRARLFNNTYKAGTSGDIVTTEKEVNKSWEIKGDAGVNVTITLQWNAADEDANYTAARSVAYMSKNDYKWWLPITPKVGATGSNPYRITASGITTFSVFGSGTEDSTLPVTWLDFVAHENEFGEVVLDWSTASEKDNEKFEIERSVDGMNFERLGSTLGNGTTTAISKYQYIDRFPLEGLTYYKIKQIDFDGNYDYSNMVAIQLGSSKVLSIDIFPNRTMGDVNLRIAGATGAYQLVVMDMMGRTYGNFELTENTVKFDITSFPAGIYIFKIATSHGTMVRRVIKQ